MIDLAYNLVRAVSVKIRRFHLITPSMVQNDLKTGLEFSRDGENDFLVSTYE